MLLLVNYRPEYQHGWGSKTYYAQLRLDPLPPASADEFLRALLGDDPSLAPLKPLLIARTLGNPLFLEESVRTLVETQVLVGERGAYRLAKPLPSIQMPATVQAVLAARIDRLPPEEVERLAQHAVRGEVWDKAVVYGRQAGEKALARSAHREASGYFEQALGALWHLPETRGTREQAIDLRLTLRTSLQALGNLGRTLALLREVEALAEALDDPHRLARISNFLSIHFRMMGAYDQAIAAGQRALAMAGDDTVQYALANQRLGLPYHDQGDYRQAIEYLRQTATSLEGARRHERFGQVFVPAVQSRAFLAVCYAELGTFAEGRTSGEDGLQIAEAVAHPGSLMLASWGLGRPPLRQGDLPRALPLLERAVRLCQEADLPVFLPVMAAPLGAAYTLAGRATDAVSLLTQVMEQATAAESVRYQVLCRLSLGEAKRLAGGVDEAWAIAEQTLALARAHQERGNEAYALHLLGTIAARREPPESTQAEVHYRQALALAEELGMRPLQAHCHRGLGMLYAKIDQRDPARAELSTAIEPYRSMEMTFWLPRAEAALAQVEGR